jgi:hypothetical protein
MRGVFAEQKINRSRMAQKKTAMTIQLPIQTEYSFYPFTFVIVGHFVEVFIKDDLRKNPNTLLSDLNLRETCEQ